MIKRLAKLRQFRAGMNVEDYLVGELRQNWLAIEQTLKSLGAQISSDTSEAESEVISLPGSVVFMANRTASFGAGNITLANAYAITGTTNSVTFYPAESGTYYINFGVRIQHSIGITHSYTITANSVSGGAIGTIASSEGGGIGIYGPTNGVFANLSPTNGLYFTAATSGTTLTNFYCEVKKVS